MSALESCVSGLFVYSVKLTHPTHSLIHPDSIRLLISVCLPRKVTVGIELDKGFSVAWLLIKNTFDHQNYGNDQTLIYTNITLVIFAYIIIFLNVFIGLH